MATMKVAVINISNHPSSGWTEAQRSGWDAIKDIPFPNVPASAGMEEVEKLAENLHSAIVAAVKELRADGYAVYLMLQGEYSLCYTLLRYLKSLDVSGLALPTSERVVQELGDGRKIAEFRFVQWRFLPLP